MNCCVDSVLKEYVTGRMNDESAVPIERHLEECQFCLENVDRLRAVDDTLMHALQNLANSDVREVEPELLSALASIRQSQVFSSADLSAPTLAVGALPQIRDYQLLRKLGEGGMGTVYLALHTRLDKQVAVKVLRHDRQQSAEAIARFEREMRLVGRLEHPQIVRALDAGIEADMHFLVMEYVDGVDLKELSRALGPLDVADACCLAWQAAAGLLHAHDNDLIHRDVKPSNLILSEQQQVKVLDLGLAQFLRPVCLPASLTDTRQVLGTIAYMSPEQCISGRAVDARSDVFSLGVSLYELLVGHLPVPPGAFAVQLPDIRTFRPDLPEALRQLLKAMLERHPDDRLDTMASVMTGLAPWTQSAHLERLIARFRRLPASEWEEKMACNGLGGEVGATHSASLSNTARDLPVPDPPPLPIHLSTPLPSVAEDGETSAGEIARPEYWLGMAGLMVAVVVIGLLLAWWTTRSPDAAFVATPEVPAPEASKPLAVSSPTGALVVHSSVDYVQDLLQQSQPYLLAVSLETRKRYALRQGENLLPPGQYRLENRAWELKAVHPEGPFVVAAGRPQHVNLAVGLDFPAHYPPIPTEFGASVTYTGSLWHQGMAEENAMNYRLKLTVMGETLDRRLRWLKVEITNVIDRYTETGYLLIDAKSYALNQEFAISEGWLTADSPAIAERLSHRGADAPSRLVARLDLANPNRDALAEISANANILLPQPRLSVQEVLVLLFGADLATASDSARLLRPGLPKDVQYARKQYLKGAGNLDCFVQKSHERLRLASGATVLAGYELWLHPDVPFRWVCVEVNSPVLNGSLSYDRRVERGDPSATATPPAELSQQAAWFDSPAQETPWDLADLGNAKDGDWVKYEIVFAGSEQPQQLEVRVLNRELWSATPQRWINVDVVSTGLTTGAKFQQSALLLLNQQAYPNRFEIVRGWVTLEGETFPLDRQGDDTQMLEGLASLDKTPEPVMLSAFDALELLFDAQLRSSKQEFRDLRGLLRSHFRTARKPAQMKYADRQNPGRFTGTVPVESWVSSADAKVGSAVIDRCWQIPLGFYQVQIQSPTHGQKPFLRAYVVRYGDGLLVDAAEEDAQRNRQAQQTSASLPKSTDNFRLWITEGGKRFWAEYAGSLNLDQGETALFYNKNGDRLEDIPHTQLLESDLTFIRQGRLFRSATNRDSWIRAIVQGFTSREPIIPRLRVTNSGTSTVYRIGDMVDRPAPIINQFTLPDQVWLRNYLKNGCHWLK